MPAEVERLQPLTNQLEKKKEVKRACLVVENNHRLKCSRPQLHWLLCLNSVWLQGRHVQVMSHKFTDTGQESGRVGRPGVDRLARTVTPPLSPTPSEKYLFSILSRRVTKQVWFPSSPGGECVTLLQCCVNTSPAPMVQVIWPYLYQIKTPLVESKPGLSHYCIFSFDIILIFHSHISADIDIIPISARYG